MSRIGNTNLGAFGGYSSSSAASKAKDASNSKNASKIEPNDYVPKRFGLKFGPPTIIVEYLIPSSGKLYHHKIKLSHLKSDSDTWDALEAIKKKNPLYFAGNKIADDQITDLINRLKKKLQGSSVGGTFLTGSEFGENKDSGSKLGKLAPLNSTASAKQNNNLTSLDNKVKGATASNSKAKDDKKNDAGNNFWAFDDLEDLEEDEEKADYGTKNLNKLSNEELQKHKNKMDVLFNKNQKKPGDGDFVYDKQEEFAATEDNEWDEEF